MLHLSATKSAVIKSKEFLPSSQILRQDLKAEIESDEASRIFFISVTY